MGRKHDRSRTARAERETASEIQLGGAGIGNGATSDRETITIRGFGPPEGHRAPDGFIACFDKDGAAHPLGVYLPEGVELTVKSAAAVARSAGIDPTAH